ncbi:MAG: GNAT family N-acetyltransferase [Pikeienuella sp.]
MIAPHERPAAGPAAAMAAAMQAGIPAIETARLRLRAPRIEDFALYAEIAISPRGLGLFGETPSRRDVWRDFAQMVATWILRGHGVWTVETREGGAPLGFILLGFEAGDHEPELGYVFAESAEGRGFAREAAEAALAHGREALALPALVSTIEPGNRRSIRLAERLGGARDRAAEAAHGNRVRVYRYEIGENCA